MVFFTVNYCHIDTYLNDLSCIKTRFTETIHSRPTWMEHLPM
jgi:hypothetical protein